ncbi:MAG: hypothetical protein WAM14_17065 [Candidatus Nitrosopolaris sp.]
MIIEEDDFDYDEFPLVGSLDYNSEGSLETNFDTEENGGVDQEVSFSDLALSRV